MADQQALVEAFKNAILLEQKADLLLTNSYLETYSPKRLLRLGLANINLVISNIKSGYGGKTVIELALDPALKNEENDDIQIGSLGVGDIVKLDRMSNAKTGDAVRTKKAKENLSKKADSDETEDGMDALEAVIIKINSTVLAVAVEEDTNDERLLSLYNNTGNDKLRMWVVKLTNSVTYKRMTSTMNKLGELKESDKTDIIRILLGESQHLPLKGIAMKESDFFNSNLNASQRQAVDFALNKSNIAIVHGPPGTGKTYTLVELIKQLTFNRKERVLVCGASNISVDTILERLSPDFSGSDDKKTRRKKETTSSKGPEKLIRIGHPARLLAGNLKHSLDILSKGGSGSDGDNQAILRDIEKDIGETLNKAKKCKRYSERRALWGELKDLKRDLRVRERKIVQELLVNSNVVLSTLHGAGSYELTSLYKEGQFSADKPLFDTIIIDEVSQTLEPQCWIPVISHLGCKRLVIAGDNMQLPPTLKSKDDMARLRKELPKEAVVADLEFTLFDRLVSKHGGDAYRMLLDTQYRMNEDIMRFPSQMLYGGKLLAAESVRGHRLADLEGVKETDETREKCLWFDTQGGIYPERASDDVPGTVGSGSKYNDMEVLVVVQYLQQLLDAGVDAALIGVISPYSAQVLALKRAILHAQVEVSTIDGFQGREKEVIVISLVRSNADQAVGFLRDFRRLNVAMTRPKRQLCVVGDLELLARSQVPFLQEWAAYVEESFDVRYPDVGDY